MRFGVITLLLIIAACVAGGYYQLLYPPKVYERSAQKSLQQFADVVNKKDRTMIAVALQDFLTDDATIDLTVNFFSVTQSGKAVAQKFDKASFITFIDNVLYPLTDYGYQAQIQDFQLGAGKTTASLIIASSEWADGVSYYGGNGVGMRFSSSTSCKGDVVFDEHKVAKLSHASCEVSLRSVPKPGEMEKMRSPEALRDLLSRQ